MTTSLTNDQRKSLAGVADVVIPDGDDAPRVGVQVHGEWIDEALGARPDLHEPLRALLDLAKPDRQLRPLRGWLRWLTSPNTNSRSLNFASRRP